MKAKLYLPIAAITFFALFPAHADYFDAVRGSVMNYKFGDFTLPANPGETTYWEEAGSLPTTVSRSDTTGSYIALSINGPWSVTISTRPAIRVLAFNIKRAWIH